MSETEAAALDDQPITPPFTKRMKAILPGLTATLIVAMAAGFLADHYGSPALLFALLLGLSLSFLSEDGKCDVGINFAATTGLRWGVALLGFRIAFDQIIDLGLTPVLILTGALALTIASGLILSRLMGLERSLGLLTGGAVAICGASAAAAIAATLPKNKETDRHLVMTVFGITSLSALAMICYPVLAHYLGFSPRQEGIFLGGSIHDVAQVVGAGYSVSPEIGDTATIVKLLRVAMLAPVVLVISIVMGGRAGAGAKRSVGIPWFLLLFIGFVLLQSLATIPPTVITVANAASRWFLIAAISALGMRTSLKSLMALGPRPLLLMVSETLILAAFMTGALLLIRV